MRVTFCLLVLVFIFVGCRKGKTLPEVVYVHYEGPTAVSQYPNGPFSPFDPFDIFEQPQYPCYIYQDESDDLANSFNNYLTTLLEKNNVILTTEPAEYSLHVTTLTVSESRYRQSYVDSCSTSWNNEPSYVYYSKLNAQLKITLKKNGYYMSDWTRNAISSEEVRDKTDACNQPKIRSIYRGPSSLVDQLAKEVRVKIANKLYDLETN